MKKPTYYLWPDTFLSRGEYESEKAKLISLGFRVVTCFNGPKENGIQKTLYALIHHHLPTE